jgi:RecA/RadA recombinase
VVPLGFTTASMVAQARQDVIMITTGSAKLDEMLGGESLPEMHCLSP